MISDLIQPHKHAQAFCAVCPVCPVYVQLCVRLYVQLHVRLRLHLYLKPYLRPYVQLYVHSPEHLNSLAPSWTTTPSDDRLG